MLLLCRVISINFSPLTCGSKSLDSIHFFSQEIYLKFLQNYFPHLSEALPLVMQHNMWFMSHGAPSHCSLAVQEHLNVDFKNKWVGKEDLVACSLRSPELNPLNILLGYLQTLIYARPIINRENLLKRIIFPSREIRINVAALKRILGSSIHRARECIRLPGDHVEPTYIII